MATLGQAYSNGHLGISVKKTHMVPIESLYIEDGFNVRDIDFDHVHNLSLAYEAGEELPPLWVIVTEKGVKVVDGHHRFLAINEAKKRGYNMQRVECKDFKGDEAAQVAFMIKSSQGRALSAYDRSASYVRLEKLGLTISEIAKQVGRSESDVREHLKLAECEPEVIEMVKRQEIAFGDALALQRKHGAIAAEIAKEAVSEAKSQGKLKATFKKFNHKTAYSRLNSEVNSIIELIDKNKLNTDLASTSDEILATIGNKLKQTMEIIRGESWQ